ncbi:hypothetical protein Fcan01_00831 [Folsomia candida]|uniref:DUF7869 domain-containing protein n=1 Tax=Folsomia candida TaxID=158441 RepID=A0A226F099_FOLCA|nr:hypothetical protein Fcan01_00831 [Folsomia candida]
MSEQFRITVNELCHINDGKKRKINFDDWQNKKNKMSKDRGEEYVGGRGIVKQAKIPPPQVQACPPRCSKPGCRLPFPRRQQIFQEFWGTGSYNRQTDILAGMIDVINVNQRTTTHAQSRRQHSYAYYLSNDQGLKVPVCVSTFLSTFGITPDRLRTVKEKLASGTVDLADKRGTNTLHERVDPTHTDRILAHINSFPRKLSHYSREAGNPLREYLDPTLTVSKMFTLFRIQEGEHVNRLEWLYRQVFREQPLKIGIPRSDTCDLCDKLFIQLSGIDVNDPAQNARRREIEMKSQAHHLQAETSYEELQLDNSLANEDYVVIAVDLQAEGSRGACEIANCIKKYCTENFPPLNQGQVRHLIVFSDRCGGQNNNFETLCMYRWLISKQIFSSVNQKFLVSGHSFLPCDRQFAILENARKKTTLIEFSDIENMIRNACHVRPFLIQRMELKDFLNLQPLVQACPLPRTLKVSQVLSIRMVNQAPNVIEVKSDHDSVAWTQHHSVLHNNFANIHLRPLRPHKIPIPPALLADLKNTYEFIPIESRNFWRFLE